MNGARLSSADFHSLVELLGSTYGLHFETAARGSLERRLAPRVSARGFRGFPEYVSYLRFSEPTDPEWDELVHRVTVHETYFFRERMQLASFSEEVMPMLAKKNESTRNLTLWSAGCSTGEEVYSLAILLLRSRLFDGWNLHLYGTDVSRHCIQAARRGIYGPQSFRGCTPDDYAGHVVRDGESYEVSAELRKMCHFSVCNLTFAEAPLFFGRADVVFCRNVLIYLTEHAKGRLVSLFYERLAPEGVLFLGHAESLLHLSTAFELLHLKGDLAYTKPAPVP
ncbi:MAG: protein-glutamate O-methyltransferase CheR [Polyangiaceae bacterium]